MGKRISLVILILSIVMFTVIIMFHSHNKDEIRKDVSSYLHEQGYNKEEIKKIEGFRSKTGYEARVIFNDEPEVTYFYTYDKKYGGVLQEGVNTSKTNLGHLE
ncbi:DUF3139 domain-containing protein [Aquibacillus kalidii]|uniref:DUF3139 domain-containing protein n=1 Tax=Aquibacillus kalidii TaxID=2762597 RepID=UPI0016449100|nr:DUF3139 domain-containing protein [Aquibacillus kalidii]